MKEGDKIKYYNTSSNKWIDGVIQRIDNITYSIPIFIVLSNAGVLCSYMLALLLFRMTGTKRLPGEEENETQS